MSYEEFLEKKREKAKEDLGCMYDVADTVIMIESTDENEKEYVVEEVEKLIPELLSKLKKRIEVGGEIEAKVVLTLLLVAMTIIIRVAVQSEDFDLMVDNITTRMKDILANDE